MMEERTKQQTKDLNEKKEHLRNVFQLLNFYYPSGIPKEDIDLDRCPNHVRQYIRDVLNAKGIYCYRPELEDDDKNYWAKNSNDDHIREEIIQQYINGADICELRIKYNWPTCRIRTLLQDENVYIRNRFLFILEPKTAEKPMLMFDTLREVCKVLKISPSNINDYVDTIFKGWLITRRDLVKELYLQNERKRRYQQSR